MDAQLMIPMYKQNLKFSMGIRLRTLVSHSSRCTGTRVIQSVDHLLRCTPLVTVDEMCPCNDMEFLKHVFDLIWQTLKHVFTNVGFF